MQGAAEPSQLLLFVSNVIVFVDQLRSKTQLKNEAAYPDAAGSDDHYAILTSAADHLDTAYPGGIVGDNVPGDELPMEHIGDGTIKHGFDVAVDVHDENVAGLGRQTAKLSELPKPTSGFDSSPSESGASDASPSPVKLEHANDRP